MTKMAGKVSTIRPFARLVLVAGCTAVLAATSTAAAASADARPSGPAAGVSRSPHACAQWKIAGKWTSGQSNDNHVFYHFAQRGTKLHGYATLPRAEASRDGFSRGRLTGTMKGTRVQYLVVWNRSSVDGIVHRGDYRGTVTSGKIIGSSRDLAVPGSTATFKAKGPTSCLKR